MSSTPPRKLRGQMDVYEVLEQRYLEQKKAGMARMDSPQENLASQPPQENLTPQENTATPPKNPDDQVAKEMCSHCGRWSAKCADGSWYCAACHAYEIEVIEWPPEGMETVQASDVLEHLVDYTILNAEIDMHGRVTLDMQGVELPSVTLKIQGGLWALEVYS